MKTVRIETRHFFLNVRGLTVMYFLLCALTVFFSRTYFVETLEGGTVPGTLPFLVFVTIPLALLVFLGVSIVRLIRESLARTNGARFQARLFAYFIITVALAAVPVTVITTQAVYVLVRYWRSTRLEAALSGAESLAMDLYNVQTGRCLNFVRNRAGGIDALFAAAERSAANTRAVNEDAADTARLYIGPEAFEAAAGSGDLLAAQDFRRSGGDWIPGVFAGRADLALDAPPSGQTGFAPRELPRDRDVFRYAQAAEGDRNRLRVFTWRLGAGFDETVAIVDAERTRYSQINNLGANLQIPLIFYYGMFFFPTLLMTAIIAISFTRRVSRPILELTDAAHRVAGGDFSVQILVRQKDELGAMIQSFNAMVRDLRKSKDAQLEAEKISIWQTMAQQLAHEIKNPLTPIKLSAERVLRRWQNSPDRIGEILESSMMAVIQEVEGLSGMLGEFRTLSRPLEPAQTWTGLKAAIAGGVAPFVTPYPKVQFKMDHVDGGVEVRMESRHLSQILNNLIINAIDAMDADGLIEFRTDMVRRRESRFCRLSIRDTGKGVAPDRRERIFTPYFTTKDNGTGLGLPIVQRIVNSHGGAIWLDSAEGAGTTFYIDFPLDVSGTRDTVENETAGERA